MCWFDLVLFFPFLAKLIAVARRGVYIRLVDTRPSRRWAHVNVKTFCASSFYHRFYYYCAVCIGMRKYYTMWVRHPPPGFSRVFITCISCYYYISSFYMSLACFRNSLPYPYDASSFFFSSVFYSNAYYVYIYLIFCKIPWLSPNVVNGGWRGKEGIFTMPHCIIA